MNITKIEIGAVDMYGWNGRDPHPTPGMTGTTGILVGAVVQIQEGGGYDPETIELDGSDDIATFNRVLLDDGRVMEILDDEIARSWTETLPWTPETVHLAETIAEVGGVKIERY